MPNSPSRASRQPILVAVDFSSDSMAALRWAGDLGRRLEVPLVILHVVHDPIDAPGLYSELGDIDRAPIRRLRDAAGELLTRFVSAADLGPLSDSPGSDGDAGSGVETLLVEGLPVPRILEVAERLEASQIVMGSRGLSGLPHLLLGSKAQRVIQLAQIPTTVVKADPELGADAIVGEE